MNKLLKTSLKVNRKKCAYLYIYIICHIYMHMSYTWIHASMEYVLHTHIHIHVPTHRSNDMIEGNFRERYKELLILLLYMVINGRNIIKPQDTGAFTINSY